jgi:hypothetical protein
MKCYDEPGNDLENKNVSSLERKVGQVGDEVTCGGSRFQLTAPAVGNDRSPALTSRDDGTTDDQWRPTEDRDDPAGQQHDERRPNNAALIRVGPGRSEMAL